jgi:hypothetical protein
VTEEEAFDAMAALFERWGSPGSLRVDNGEPFGSTRPSTTSELAMRLIGHNIGVSTNRPGVPQDNGKVERLQGTSVRWSEVLKCRTLDEAQRNLDEAITVQREQYPVSRLKGLTRAAAFPQLGTKRHQWDPSGFDPQRVYDFLSKKQYVRKVSGNAQVTHFGHKHRVGTKYVGQHVCLKFDAFALKWLVYAANGKFIKSMDAPYLSAVRIKNMTVYSKN